MNIEVHRLWPNDLCITGVMLIDSVQRFFTLELPELFDGQPNVPDKCCIPAGTYPVIRTWSNHFGQMMPMLDDVPGRSAIEVHYGNFPSDILGCILIGNKRISDTEIGDSRNAFEEFNEEFDTALANNENVTLTVS